MARVMITMPDEFLREIDEVAADEHRTEEGERGKGEGRLQTMVMGRLQRALRGL